MFFYLSYIYFPTHLKANKIIYLYLIQKSLFTYYSTTFIKIDFFILFPSFEWIFIKFLINKCTKYLRKMAKKHEKRRKFSSIYDLKKKNFQKIDELTSQ